MRRLYQWCVLIRLLCQYLMSTNIRPGVIKLRVCKMKIIFKYIYCLNTFGIVYIAACITTTDPWWLVIRCLLLDTCLSSRTDSPKSSLWLSRFLRNPTLLEIESQYRSFYLLRHIASKRPLFFHLCLFKASITCFMKIY